jgi:hypothetical protein
VAVRCSGPTYETPAEVQAGIALGGGAFGMSTVPEVLACHGHGMELFGVSLCTNMAAGLIDETLTHADVQRVATESGPRMLNFLIKLLELTPVPPSTKAKAGAHFDAAQLPRLTTSMVPVNPWQPTITEVTHDAALLAAANAGAPPPTTALLIATPSAGVAGAGAGFEQLIGSTLTDVRVLSFESLPSLARWERTRSHSARYLCAPFGCALLCCAVLSTHAFMPCGVGCGGESKISSGRFVFGSVALSGGGSARVVLITEQALEGLSAAESSFIAQLLKRIGVKTVLQLLSAADPAALVGVARCVSFVLSAANHL